MSERKDSKPVMTIIVVAINVLVFVVLEVMGDTQSSEFMAAHGAVWPPYVSEGHEYWRLLTATFMHFGFEHYSEQYADSCMCGNDFRESVRPCEIHDSVFDCRSRRKCTFLCADVVYKRLCRVSRSIRRYFWHCRGVALDCDFT